jgi:hypothetical protein
VALPQELSFLLPEGGLIPSHLQTFTTTQLDKESHPFFQLVVDAMGVNCVVSHLFALDNPFTQSFFDLKVRHLQVKAMVEGRPPETSEVKKARWLFLEPEKHQSLKRVLADGIDAARVPGLGKFFANEAKTAFYDPICRTEAKAEDTHVLLLCDIVPGSSKEFLNGRMNADWGKPQDGFESTRGNNGFMIFNGQQARVTHVVVFRYTGPNIVANIVKVILPTNLSRLLNSIERSVGPENTDLVKVLHQKLVTGQVTPEQYATAVHHLFQPRDGRFMALLHEGLLNTYTVFRFL